MSAAFWSELELVEAIRAGGTLSAAARRLGVDQTTVSRRLAGFERQIGAALFDRVEGRLAATPALAAVTARLRVMAEEGALAIAALRQEAAELEGHVRVTSVGVLLARVLAPALGEFRGGAITLELVADDQSLSFARREADIALRLSDVAEPSARLRRLGSLAMRLYRPAAAPPGPLPLLRYGEALAHVPEMLALDRARPGAPVLMRADRLDILAEAAISLGAEVMLPERIAAADPRFAPAEGAPVTAMRPLCLLIHPDRARVPSVARVADWAEATVKRWLRS